MHGSLLGSGYLQRYTTSSCSYWYCASFASEAVIVTCAGISNRTRHMRMASRPCEFECGTWVFVNVETWTKIDALNDCPIWARVITLSHKLDRGTASRPYGSGHGRVNAQPGRNAPSMCRICTAFHQSECANAFLDWRVDWTGHRKWDICMVCCLKWKRVRNMYQRSVSLM